MRKSILGRVIKTSAALLLTAFAASCQLFDNDVNDFMEKYTETAAIEEHSLSEKTYSDNSGNSCINSKKDLEVMKQFYDIGTLISEHKNFSHVLKTYKEVVASESSYRGLNLTPRDVLEDTIAAAVVIGSRGKTGKNDYPVYVEGIRGVGTHVFAERFSGEIASYRAADLIYMAACLMAEKPYEKIENFEEYADEQLSQDELKVLAKMRKAQPLKYAYLVKADRLLKECRH